MISYGNDAWKGLPSLQFANGQMSPEEYARIQTAGSTVPGLGVDLTAPGALSYENMLWLQTYNPQAYLQLKAIWAAGNRNLDNELANLKERTALGGATQPTAIQTY